MVKLNTNPSIGFLPIKKRKVFFNIEDGCAD